MREEEGWREGEKKGGGEGWENTFWPDTLNEEAGDQFTILVL